MDRKDVLKQGAERLHFAQEGGKWKAVVNTVMNLFSMEFDTILD
jgi:hypothetical protein